MTKMFSWFFEGVVTVGIKLNIVRVFTSYMCFTSVEKVSFPLTKLINLFYLVCSHYFESYPQLAEQTNYLKEYIVLLEQQLLIEVKFQMK